MTSERVELTRTLRVMFCGMLIVGLGLSVAWISNRLFGIAREQIADHKESQTEEFISAAIAESPVQAITRVKHPNLHRTNSYHILVTVEHDGCLWVLDVNGDSVISATPVHHPRCNCGVENTTIGIGWFPNGASYE